MRPYGLRHKGGWCGPHDASMCACDQRKTLRHRERQRARRLCLETEPDLHPAELRLIEAEARGEDVRDYREWVWVLTGRVP